jgi:group II intron reverse transcriptase/maturase
LRFTALAHHITGERVWENLCKIPKHSAPGVDGQTVAQAKESFEAWIEPMLASMHRGGYPAPVIRRVYIPKPGKQERRPLGVPCVADRALQRSTAEVLSAIYEQDFLPCSFGGRPGLGAHRALASLHEVIAGRKVGWVLEADLKNFFGSLVHGWLLRFVEHRVGDPRLISLIRRWLKAGILEDGEIHPNEEGTPQGGSISVLLSNVYLHYVLDLWFERVVKPRLRGEAYLVRYVDDFVLCFQYREDALRVQEALGKRLGKFGLSLEPSKTKLVEFGRFAHKYAARRGRARPETIYFLGFTLYCTRNRQGNFKVGLRTEKSRLQRSLSKLSDLMRRMRHLPVREQVCNLNQVLRGHFAYYGIAGNFRALQKVHRFVERYWHQMLCSRSRKGYLRWAVFHRIKARFPLQRPQLHLPYPELQAIAVL